MSDWFKSRPLSSRASHRQARSGEGTPWPSGLDLGGLRPVVGGPRREELARLLAAEVVAPRRVAVLVVVAAHDVVLVAVLGVVVGAVVLGRLGHAATGQHGEQLAELALELGLNTQTLSE